VATKLPSLEAFQQELASMNYTFYWLNLLKFQIYRLNFLNYLLPGDEVMADRGFTIEDFLFPCRVKLDIPAFTKCKPQLSNEDVTTTRRIAHVRIHVERAIRR
jgi:hypothetical protein